MDLHDMRIFARVAAVQNLSSVGTELGLTPGTISKRIQALEEELSVRLFDRTTRSIRITEEGGKLLEYVERILSEVEHARAAISANVEQPKGRLRVSAPASFSRFVIAPAICSFIERYEDIEVHIDLTDRMVNLQEDGYDVVIRAGVLDDCTLKAKRLAPDPQVLVASPAYLKRHQSPPGPELLSQHSCLILGDSPVWTFRRNGEETSVRVNGRLRSDNGELLRHAAIEGHGILRVSELRVRDEIKSGHLSRVLEGYEVASASAIWALYPSARHVLPKLRVFMDFLAEWFRDPANANTINGARLATVPTAPRSPAGELRAPTTKR
ncbi:MAG: LysR family transcriptional regulator [Hyphomicrobiaceae bacterium]